MLEYMELGSTPCGEDCVQVDKEKEYLEDMIIECKRYRDMLRKRFPVPEETRSVYFKVKSFQHDFGSYREVCIFYDEENRVDSEFALFVEGNLPEKWSDDKVLTFDISSVKEEEYE